jgi:hypothetical protein
MKKVFPLIFFALVLGCRTEQDVEPARSSTFFRYFGSENNNTAVLALEADNGFSLLSNVDIPTDPFGNFINKIRFIHTDTYGNLVWRKEYPSFEDQKGKPGEKGGYKGNSFITLDNGYLIIGERINGDESTDLLLIEIDFTGTVLQEQSMKLKNGLLSGRAVTIDNTGDFIVLASITGMKPKDMFVAKLSRNYDSIWSRLYGDGDTQLVNRIFTATNESLLWGGSVKLSGQSDIRLIQAPEDSEGTDNPRPLGNPDFDETASDFCEWSGGYAFIGTTRNNSGGDEDILISRVTGNGALLPSVQINFDSKNPQNDEGNSISVTHEGGFIILSTVESSTRGNGKKDYYLCKLFGSGKTEWEVNYGGSDDETGASVRETSDGGFLVFGTTSFGSLSKLMLMKVDRNGKL